MSVTTLLLQVNVGSLVLYVKNCIVGKVAEKGLPNPALNRSKGNCFGVLNGTPP